MKIDLQKITAGLKDPKVWFSWALVTLGTLVLAAGFVLFTNPYKIIPGGVYGLGRILHHVVPTIQTGTFGLILDVPLLTISFIIFGSKFGAKTIYAALLTPLFMNLLTSILGENPTDNISIISQYINFSDNILVAAIFGGLLIGTGCGVILRAGATSGGTDILALIIVKYTSIKYASAMLMVETTVVLLGMLVLQDWKLPLYSLVSIYVAAKAIDFVLDGASYDKILYIISDKKEELRTFILQEMERGGTYIKSTGMYSGEEKEMVFLVVSRRQITAVKNKIRVIDPTAFVVVVDAYETYGDGFKNIEEQQ